MTLEFIPSDFLSPEAALRKIEAAINEDGGGSSSGPLGFGTTLDMSGITSILNNASGVLTVSPFTSLDVNNSGLTALDISGATALTTLVCSANSLTALDVSTNTALTALVCSTNSLTALAVNTILSDLDTAGLSGGTVDLSGGSNAAPTSGPPDGLTAKANLIGKGWTITTN